MQKTTLALAFFSLLSFTACKEESPYQKADSPAAFQAPKTERQDQEVTGMAAAAEQRFAPPGTVEVDGGVDAGDAGTGMPTDAGAGTGGSGDEEACLDRWLEQKGLDRFGNAEGTVYMGGTPLFDERTGEQTPRAEYVYRRHAGAKAACASGK